MTQLTRSRLAALFAVSALVCLERKAHAALEGDLALVVHGDGLPIDALKSALERELAHAVVVGGDASHDALAGTLTVTYHRSTHELAVTWDTPARGTVSRVVKARDRVEDVIGDAALLAANLARDEADDLLPKKPAQTAPPEPVAAEPASPTPPPPAPSPTASEVARAESHEHVPAMAALVYPLATNLGHPYARTSFAFNLGYGRAGELDGLQLGIVNVVAAPSALGTGDVSGVQLSLAGGNVATGTVRGVQQAMLFNAAGQDMLGWQMSALANVTGAEVDGFQAAGGVNVAGDVRGVQLGLVNVARTVHGMQLGLVNVAEDVEGMPLGLVSVTKNGGVHPIAWASNTSFGNAGIKFATRHFYTVVTGHYHYAYDRDFVGPGFTMGGHIPIRDFYVDVDLGFTWLYAPDKNPPKVAGQGDGYHQDLLLPKLRVIAGISIAEHLHAFLGTGLTVQFHLEDQGDTDTIRVGPEFLAGVEL